MSSGTCRGGSSELGRQQEQLQRRQQEQLQGGQQEQPHWGAAASATRQAAAAATGKQLQGRQQQLMQEGAAVAAAGRQGDSISCRPGLEEHSRPLAVLLNEWQGAWDMYNTK